MDIRTTAPYLESCLSHLLAEGDLALRSSLEGHLQLRDSVGIAPTSLPRGSYDPIARAASPLVANPSRTSGLQPKMGIVSSCI